MSVLPFKGRRLLPPSWIQGVWCLTFLICVLKNDYVQGKKSIPNISEIFPTTYLLWKSSLHQFCHPQNSVLHLNCFWNSCLLEMVPKREISLSHIDFFFGYENDFQCWLFAVSCFFQMLKCHANFSMNFNQNNNVVVLNEWKNSAWNAFRDLQFFDTRYTFFLEKCLGGSM